MAGAAALMGWSFSSSSWMPSLAAAAAAGVVALVLAALNMLFKLAQDPACACSLPGLHRGKVLYGAVEM